MLTIFFVLPKLVHRVPFAISRLTFKLLFFLFSPLSPVRKQQKITYTASFPFGRYFINYARFTKNIPGEMQLLLSVERLFFHKNHQKRKKRCKKFKYGEKKMNLQIHEKKFYVVHTFFFPCCLSFNEICSTEMIFVTNVTVSHLNRSGKIKNPNET